MNSKLKRFIQHVFKKENQPFRPIVLTTSNSPTKIR